MCTHTYITQGVCAKAVDFTVEDGRVYDVVFHGGCNGNLKAISKLVDGMETQKVIEILRGNTCGPRMTSCADQFAQALEAVEE
jgi:uncharacterized protein (TIGR03905 family)